MHDFQKQFQIVFHTVLCLSLFASMQCIIKQLLYSVFAISVIIKASVSVISDNSYLDLDSKEVSFEWSLQRISPTDSKVRATLQKSFIHYAGESIKS